VKPVGLALLLIASGLLWFLPRRLAVMPMLMVAAWIPFDQELEIATLHFPALRMVVVAGLLRVLCRRERLSGGANTLDRLVILWAMWLVCSSAFHDPRYFITRLGEVFTDVGLYWLFRVFVRNTEDIRYVFKTTCILLLPVGAGMLLEKAFATNYCSLLFGGNGGSYIRNGHVRALGPYAHAITAGTIGAVCLPMALCYFRRNWKLAVLGIAGTAAMVFSSNSSGPMMTLFAVVVGMASWRVRGYLGPVRWLVVLGLVALDLVMNDPVYFLIARVDLAGGSTSYFRAQLIRSGIQHLDEWWLTGTDHTRHWMATGTGWNLDHTDITNHYLQMGVWGGLPLLALFVTLLCVAFGAVGNALRSLEGGPSSDSFLVWTLGAILFGHAAAFNAVSYYDQTVAFFYLVVASIASLGSIDTQPVEASQADEINEASSGVPQQA
jgi:hypothetical protein